MSGAASAAVVIGLLAGFLLLWRLPTLPDADGCASAALLAGTSVIIPARNEAVSLPDLLTSLSTQSAPPLEVIVVDDGSADATAGVARAAGARVVPAGSVPEGWLGKPWACQRGVEAAVGERFVLLDADTRLAPDGLARLVAGHAALVPEGLLSVQPFHAVERAYEQLSALANVVPVLASGMAAAGPVSRRRMTVAFGPCLVTTSTALAAVGGMTSVRSSIIEDVALAQSYVRAGRPVRCLGGGPTVRFRMYPRGPVDLIEGWTKNLASGAASAPVLSTVGAVMWVVALVLVAVAGVRGVVAVVSGGGGPALVVLAAWAAVTAQLGWMLRRLGSFRWWCAVAFPVPLVAFVALFVRSAWVRVLRRPVTWRGRRIDARAGVR
ncbi:MAG: glycosyltransferase family 2 protein [Acidimicrobiales bacterium]